MKYEITLDAEKLRDSITEAISEGAEDTSIIIRGQLYKNGDVTVDNVSICGTCTTEYLSTIDIDCNSITLKDTK